MKLPLYTLVASVWTAVSAVGTCAVMGEITAELVLPKVLEREVGTPFDIVIEARLRLQPRTSDSDVFGAERTARAQLASLFEVPVYSSDTLDYSWAILVEGAPVIRLESSGAEDGSGVLIASSTWTLASLEAGARKLPAPAWGAIDFGESQELNFLGLLKEGEDEARALAGFPELPVLRVDEAQSKAWQLAVGVLGVLLLAGFLVGRRSRGASDMGPKVVRQRINDQFALLSDLATPGSGASVDDIRAAYFNLTKLVRSNLELDLPDAAGRAVVGMTDGEWAETIGASDALRELLVDAGNVKYGGETATCWGLAGHLELAAQIRADAVRTGSYS